jgi:hypothetical protein
LNVRNLLIASYFFPPHPTVAARRWVKFAKYLQRDGVRVTVLTSRAPKGAVSSWDSDLAGLEVVRIPGRYPRILDRTPKTITEKAHYKLAAWTLRRIVRGTIYDRTVFWRQAFLKAAARIIEEKEIDTLVANGPPFRFLTYCLELRSIYPHLRVVCDFRDPWTWWHNYGYPHLSAADMRFEEYLEAKVVREADLITVPYEIMKDHLVRKYPDRGDFIDILPHAYDPDEVPLDAARTPRSRILKLVCYGTLYRGLDTTMKNLEAAIRKHAPRVTLDVFTDSGNYSSMFDNLVSRGLVHIFRPVRGKDLFLRFGTYDFVLTFNFPGHENFLCTKYPEIIQTRTPILLIGEHGTVAEFITENSLGLCVTASGLGDLIEKLLHDPQYFRYNAAFNTAPFAFPAVTGQLERMLSFAGAPKVGM